ncbi:uncharacterized protein A4U43_C08F8650 [Asparagus officinalis]|nr:uncharacterized protein A4U43_C08F8650 [Asparagus officinalis]
MERQEKENVQLILGFDPSTAVALPAPRTSPSPPSSSPAKSPPPSAQPSSRSPFGTELVAAISSLAVAASATSPSSLQQASWSASVSNSPPVPS